MGKTPVKTNLTNWKAIFKQVSINFDLFQSKFFLGSFISHTVNDPVTSLAENVELFKLLNATTGVDLKVHERKF